MAALLSAVFACAIFGAGIAAHFSEAVPTLVTGASIGVLVGAVLSQVLRPAPLPRAGLGVTATARPLLGADGAGGRGHRRAVVVCRGAAGQDEPETQEDVPQGLQGG